MSLALGPIPASDSPLMRRVRVHQAWYRAEVLGVPSYGNLAGSGRPCASVLPDFTAGMNLNFVGDDAAERYMDRRKNGWGVDPVRCEKYLTSSQALTFNMLAQAVSRPQACARLFNRLLNRHDLFSLESSDFEFAAQGTPYALGDKTLLDLLLRFRTDRGSLQVVALETKLADRFSTRRTIAANGESYSALAFRSGLWADFGAAVRENRTRQLARCHALAQSVQEQDGHLGGHAILLVLMLPEDRVGRRCVSDYANLVSPETFTVRAWGEYLLAARSEQAIDAPIGAQLTQRYVEMGWSERAWSAFEESTLSSSRRSA